MPTLVAYNGDRKLKAKLITQIRRHRKAEQLVKGSYWIGNGEGKGCAVGCLTHDPKGGHVKYESLWGIPVELAYLEDALFEGLPVKEAQEWPERFLKAIKPGANLSLAWPKFALRMFNDEKHGMAFYAKDYPDALKIIKTATALFERVVAGDPPKTEEWNAAWRAARAAMAAMAAMDAMDARAARAAMDAMAAMDARAARDAMAAMAARAAMAAMDAMDAMDAMAARAASWIRLSDWLIEIIQAS
jgi:hypothetical protein